ncbi:amidohydrolase family protein [Marinoscillum sp. MHG1-6]|uniref:amidohydrolase family protein n=1 Tax=Marinoscillum sp. MHG1-6 TaxID=2959627 RepID=UPI0021587A60|nr:amidohydrolase family protein [Marinoscillum sp. MHG1-6]
MKSNLNVNLFFLLLSIQFLNSCKQVHKSDIAITNISLIDVKEGKILENKVLLIQDEKIKGIYPANTKFNAKQVIEGSGKYLIPGLWDMHVHTLDLADHFFPMYIANGITGIRDAGNMNLDSLSRWRQEINNGTRIGPEMLVGSMLDADRGSASYPNTHYISDTTSIDALILQQKLAGADFIKAYHFLSPAQFTEISEACKTHNIPFSGHVPILTPPYETVTHCSNLGQSCIEHGIQIHFAIANKEYVMQNYFDVGNCLQDIIDHIDIEKEKRLYDHFIKNNTWISTTSSIFWGVGQVDQQPNGFHKYWLEYMPNDAIEQYNWYTNPFQDVDSTIRSGKDFDIFRRAALGSAQLMKRMHDYGVNLIAGSDSPNPMIVPGYGLHKEFEILVEGGFSPLEVLQLSTIKAAEFLERSDIGVITKGANADLVILNSNPLLNISNTSSIDGVILKGKYLNRLVLDEMLVDAKELLNKK